MDNLIDFVPLILVGLIGLIVGALIGAFIGNFINRSENTGQQRRQHLVEILRVWKDRHSGDVKIEIEGKIFTSPEKLGAKRYSGLVGSLEELNRWMGISQPKESPQSSPKPLSESPSTPQLAADQPSSAPEPAPPAPEDIKDVSREPQVIEKTPLPPYEIIENSTRENKSSSVFNPVNVLERVLRQKSDAEPSEPKSIAAQIDEILQQKLPSSPLRNHVIKLLELPEKGLVVLVDQKEYQGVGEVPDLEVRALLQECVAEWEQSVSS
jgi:hypothetical protein